MRFGRKIHATHLHQSGVPVEIIDALQGRTPVSIFAKHYYRPSSDYKVKVLEALEISSYVHVSLFYVATTLASLLSFFLLRLFFL
jgi:intergrase/recombinase